MDGKVLGSFDEAVADVAGGATILLGGFGPGTPWNLIAALYRQGARELTIVCNSASGGSAAQGRDDLIAHATLIEAGRVRKVIASFTAATHPSRKAPLELLHEEGRIEAELVPQGTLAERIRAAGAGVPAFFTATAAGTKLAQGKETREFNGRQYVMETALKGDLALVEAWEADRWGNLVYRTAARNFGPTMATAAALTVVQVSEFVELGELDPECVVTPGIFVDRVVQVAA